MKDLELIELYERYKNFLTTHQKDMFKEYYILDFSLGEIAENHNISRQSVNDSIKKAENQLTNYEKALNLSALKKELKELLDENDKEKLKTRLSQIIKEI